MRTSFLLYENIYNDSKTGYISSQLKFTKVCNGFKVYKKLLPDLSTRTWTFNHSDTIYPLKVEHRSDS